MSRRTLTTKWLESAKCPDAKRMDEIYDVPTPGLSIRLFRATPSKKSWTFLYTPPGGEGRARMSLGTFPATDLAGARERALQARTQLEKGLDPKAPPPVRKTIADLIDDRIRLVTRKDADNYLRTCMEIERVYDVDVIPVVGLIPVQDFDIPHMNLILDPIVDRGADIQANRVCEHVKALLAFAKKRGEIKYNPIDDYDAPSDENTGTRNLSLEEIAHFWHTAPQALIRSPKVQRILKICLATGKRLSEVAGMKRTEINRLAMMWTIPKERVKQRNKQGKKRAQPELVPLSDFALALIDEAMLHSNSEFVFPNDEGTGGYRASTVGKCLKLALDPTPELPLGRLGMEPWTAHALRRTVGTQMLNIDNGLGISKFQKKLALNHEIKEDVSDIVYDQNTYIKEKASALVKWGVFLARLVGEEIEQREAA